MKVRELMTSDVSSCQKQSTLTQIVTIMWQRDCGVVPVVDEHHKIVGIVTDRDICVAVATQNRLASDIMAGEIIYGAVKSCSPSDDVDDALKIMRKHQLRRLPVTDSEGTLLGIVSISDFLRHTKGKDKVPAKKLLKTLREISSFRPVFLHEISVEENDDEAEDGFSDESGNKLELSETNDAESENSGI